MMHSGGSNIEVKKSSTVKDEDDHLELYDRRLKIYKELHRLLAIVIRNSKIEQCEFNNFIVNVSETDFLFGHEVTEYLKEISDHALKLQRWNEEYRDFTQPPKDGYNHKEVVDGIHKELNWLSNQFEPAKKIFQKYIKLKNK